jgi:hypothetical protein
MQLTYPDGEVATVLAGPVTVTADVTDSTRSFLRAVESEPDAEPAAEPSEAERLKEIANRPRRAS